MRWNSKVNVKNQRKPGKQSKALCRPSSSSVPEARLAGRNNVGVRGHKDQVMGFFEPKQIINIGVCGSLFLHVQQLTKQWGGYSLHRWLLDGRQFGILSAARQLLTRVSWELQSDRRHVRYACVGHMKPMNQKKIEISVKRCELPTIRLQLAYGM